jgi:hypothetical protein
MTYEQPLELIDDGAYYSRRAAEETARVETAVTPAAKQAHAELAEIFAKRAQEAPSRVEGPVGQGPIEVYARA